MHCDCNGFYASVECMKNPELKKVPMVVGGDPEGRHGVVLAKNELAKAYGIVTGESVWNAKRKCPQAVFVRPNHSDYAKVSRLVNNIYLEFTDRVEPFGIDESWLDVTEVLHLFGTGQQIADRLREEVKKRIGITISVGVSFNKIFAKLGSDMKKPDATTCIMEEDVEKKVYPLPVSDLLYVGKKSREKLSHMGIYTIGDLAKYDRNVLYKFLGKQGDMIWRYANGLDFEEVKKYDDYEEVKSVGNGWTFRRDLVGEEDIRGAIKALSEEVAFRLRKKNLKCSTVSIGIKDTDFISISRQKSLSVATNLSYDIEKIGMELVRECWNFSKPIRMMSVTAMNLVDEKESFSQLSFFDNDKNNETREKYDKLERTMDMLREKFGKEKVSLGGAGKKHDLGLGTFHKEDE